MADRRTNHRNGRATIKDVAAHANVSVATVSRVLAGSYPTSAASKAKVHKAVAELDYVVNPHARALAGRGTGAVAVLLASVTTPFYAAVAQGVEEEASRQGRLCLIGTTGGDATRELATVELVRDQGVEAVILVGGFVREPDYDHRMGHYATSLAAAGSRLVLCGRPALGPDSTATVVTYDNEGGAFAAVSHLVTRGHRRIVHLGGLTGWTTSEDRVAGWRRALRAFGADADPGLEVLGGFGQQYGYQALRARIREHGGPDFTAVFAYDDHVATGALRAIREAGLSVPDDVSVVGYDDVPIAAHMAPALTTVHVPMEELGRAAARAALGERDAEPVVLGTHLVLRGSVGDHAPAA